MGVYLAISLVTSALMSFLRMADQPEPGSMSDVAVSTFVREALIPERPAPVKTTGFVGFLRHAPVSNSPTNILLTISGPAAGLRHRRARH